MGSRKSGESDTNQRKLLIGDDLLIEILSRIPTTVVAIRCKLVCKGWCSLISSHYFISKFKKQHMMHGSRYPKPLLGMLASTVRRINITEHSENDEFNFRGFNLDYIPKKNGKIVVLASCNDLILCRESYTCNYYLCNPFTMQWFALPPPPSHSSKEYIRIGLVCEPDNGSDPFRYRIVRFYVAYDKISLKLCWPVEMYCSETGEWIRCDDLDEGYYLFESKITAYNGKLYWVNKGGEYLATYDPFDMTQTSLRLNNGVGGDNQWDIKRSHVEECEGVLRVTRFEPYQPGGDDGLSYKGISLWELQEGEMIFKEHIVFNQEYIHRSCLKSIWGAACFHPRNKDVLFLTCGESLASFNTKTREFKVETKFKDPYSYKYAFTLQLTWWPTPILSPSPIL